VEQKMANSKPLHLYEEIMLLALRDEQGTIATGFAEQAVAGAILAELLLDGRVSVDETKKQLVNLINIQACGDPVIDE
jgi:Golgi phosphoprotein 3